MGLKKNDSKQEGGDNKKELIKKRQSKLMAKMKKKANKFLDQKQVNTKSTADKTLDTTNSKEETHSCAFCQEELHSENFISHPYGNFIYCQSTKLLYYSMV